MNPYFISVIVGTLLGLKRTCPECNKVQVVPASKKNKNVPCKFCKANIPPTKQTSS